MPLYSLSQRTSPVSANFQASFECIAGGNQYRLLEFSWIAATAQASWFALARSALVGSAPVGSLFQPDDPNSPASTTLGATSWSSRPTVTGEMLRKGIVFATAGAGILWTFPQGLVVRPGKSLVVWNSSFLPAADINCVIEE